jgi:hypothetical protein
MSKLIRNAGLKMLTIGTVYGFACTPNSIYQMVFAVQFSPLSSLNPVQQEAVELFAKYVPAAAKHDYEAKGNSAQNAEDERCMYLA